MEIPRDLMNRFMTGVPDLDEEECRLAMLVDDMDIGCPTNRRVKTKEGDG